MDLFVGVLRIDLYLAENRSLKERRSVVRSVLDRARARYNVAVCDVSETEDPRHAAVAFACVGAHQHLLRQTLERLLRRIETDLPSEVHRAEIEIR